jgi:hypothetical protein
MIILQKFESDTEKWETSALLYAERYGIVDYKVISFMMIWTVELRNEGTFEHCMNLEKWTHDCTQTKKAY